MSSRALRKLRREQEEQNRLAALDKPDEETESEEDATAPSRPSNTFDMLNGDEGEGDIVKSGVDTSSDSETEPIVSQLDPKAEHKSAASKPKRPKKRKNKRKNKIVGQIASKLRNDGNTDSATELDEIDLALKSLATDRQNDPTKPTGLLIDESNAQLYRLLAVESKHLNALNEMKRLFGNVVMESEEGGAAVPRRRGRGPQQVDLGGALDARNSPISRGQGLKGLAIKRNPLIVGKEEWPQATSGGLGMELVEKMEDGTVEYRFVHNKIYQDVQEQFESCVESMDPHRMIAMLQYNPYHVLTLLQVSEIAKQQGDHSVSGDLLERALFTFGRSVHSTFTSALSEGKARLDFRRPENREFWLAAWRYINNLGQRGTWRTAYEWAKLILSLDPEGDPFCVVKNLDQLALRGGQSEHYLRLSQHPFFSDDLWKPLPNVHISASLAQYRLKQPQACRSTLTKAVTTYPWIFARFFQELNISHLPKSIWGSRPRTDRERFDTELYVHNAKDLWSTPEAIAFLVEVVESTTKFSPPPSSNTPVTLDEARHVLLCGIPALINLIPRTFTSMPVTASDPLPPPDSIPSYDSSNPQTLSHHRDRDLELEDEYADLADLETPPSGDNSTDAAFVQELRGLSGLFRRMIPWFGNATVDSPLNSGHTDEEIESAAAEEGITGTELEQRRGRFMELLARALGGRGSDRSEAYAERAIAAGLRGQPMSSERENETGLERARAETGSPPVAHDPRNYAFDDEEHNEDDEAQFTVSDSVAPRRTDEPSPAPNPTSSSSIAPGPEEEDRFTTDDRLQRYLAGTGLMQLKDYTITHGTIPAKWPDNEGHDLVLGYARKLKQLRNQQTRAFILNYVLPQGTSREVRTLVESKVEGSG